MTKKSETLEMATLYRSGMTLQQIADRYGISRQAVHRRLNYHGITIADRPRGIARINKERLEALYEQNTSIENIAEELGVPKYLVIQALRFYKEIPKRRWIFKPGGKIAGIQRKMEIGETYEVPYTNNKYAYIQHHTLAKTLGIKIKTKRVGDKIKITRIA